MARLPTAADPSRPFRRRCERESLSTDPPLTVWAGIDAASIRLSAWWRARFRLQPRRWSRRQLTVGSVPSRTGLGDDVERTELLARERLEEERGGGARIVDEGQRATGARPRDIREASLLLHRAIRLG